MNKLNKKVKQKDKQIVKPSLVEQILKGLDDLKNDDKSKIK